MLALEGGRERSTSSSVSLQTDVDTQTERLDVFECNICLDSAQEPVVTFCGHLYCWPCVYKWLECSAEPACPVCKGPISPKRLIPVYGRGKPHFDPRVTLGGAVPADVPQARQIPSRPHSRRPDAQRRGGGVGGGSVATMPQHDAFAGLPALGGVPVSLLAYAREQRCSARVVRFALCALPASESSHLARQAPARARSFFCLRVFLWPACLSRVWPPPAHTHAHHTLFAAGLRGQVVVHLSAWADLALRPLDSICLSASSW